MPTTTRIVVDTVARDFCLDDLKATFLNEEVAAEVLATLASAVDIARPRILYGARDASLGAGSAYLAKILEPAGNAYPFVVTVGGELEGWSRTIDDVYLGYMVDAFKRQLVSWTEQYLEALLRREQPGGEGGAARFLNTVYPGSSRHFPLGEQRRVFAQLGDVEREIGVELNAQCFMRPSKSISGIKYFADECLSRCADCMARDHCEHRIRS